MPNDLKWERVEQEVPPKEAWALSGLYHMFRAPVESGWLYALITPKSNGPAAVSSLTFVPKPPN